LEEDAQGLFADDAAGVEEGRVALDRPGGWEGDGEACEDMAVDVVAQLWRESHEAAVGLRVHGCGGLWIREHNLTRRRCMAHRLTHH